MATTITWHIANLERETADGFVYTAHYTVDAKDAKNEAYTAGAYGSIGLERPDNLIPFADLTEDLVISWVKEKLGDEQVANISAALEAQINEQQHPTKAAGIPW